MGWKNGVVTASVILVKGQISTGGDFFGFGLLGASETSRKKAGPSSAALTRSCFSGISCAGLAKSGKVWQRRKKKRPDHEHEENEEIMAV